MQLRTFSYTDELAKERRKVENSLAVLSSTLDATSSALLVVGEDGQILHINSSFIELWGFGSDPALNATQLFERQYAAVEDAERFRECVNETGPHSSIKGRDEVSFSDGRVFEWFVNPVMVGETRIGRLWVWRDVTRTRQEAQEL